mmetsp:Transcript_44716/g.112711  ORF Transcript_44716/g.112711 Transcript_44716/m.112711 type:complete len:1221 (-) Transcript_44716:56-3718(-)
MFLHLPEFARVEKSQQNERLWLEFLLDENLIHSHLAELQKGNLVEPDGPALIHLFLAQAERSSIAVHGTPQRLSKRAARLFQLSALIVEKLNLTLQDVEKCVPAKQRRQFLGQLRKIAIAENKPALARLYELNLLRWVLRAVRQSIPIQYILPPRSLRQSTDGRAFSFSSSSSSSSSSASISTSTSASYSPTVHSDSGMENDPTSSDEEELSGMDEQALCEGDESTQDGGLLNDVGLLQDEARRALNLLTRWMESDHAKEADTEAGSIVATQGFRCQVCYDIGVYHFSKEDFPMAEGCFVKARTLLTKEVLDSHQCAVEPHKLDGLLSACHNVNKFAEVGKREVRGAFSSQTDDLVSSPALVRIEIALLEGDAECLLRLLEEDNFRFLSPIISSSASFSSTACSSSSSSNTEDISEGNHASQPLVALTVMERKEELTAIGLRTELPFHYRLFLESAPAAHCLEVDPLLSQKVKCLNLVYRALRTPPPHGGPISVRSLDLSSSASFTSTLPPSAAVLRTASFDEADPDTTRAIHEYLAVYANTWTAPRLQTHNDEVLRFLFDSCTRAVGLLSERGHQALVPLIRERLEWFVRMLCFKVDSATCWELLRDCAPHFWHSDDQQQIENALLANRIDEKTAELRALRERPLTFHLSVDSPTPATDRLNDWCLLTESAQHFLSSLEQVEKRRDKRSFCRMSALAVKRARRHLTAGNSVGAAALHRRVLDGYPAVGVADGERSAAMLRGEHRYGLVLSSIVQAQEMLRAKPFAPPTRARCKTVLEELETVLADVGSPNDMSTVVSILAFVISLKESTTARRVVAALLRALPSSAECVQRMETDDDDEHLRLLSIPASYRPRPQWVQSICALCVTLLDLMDSCDAFVNMVMMSMMSEQGNFETAEISKDIFKHLNSFLQSVVADPAFFDYFQVGGDEEADFERLPVPWLTASGILSQLTEVEYLQNLVSLLAGLLFRFRAASQKSNLELCLARYGPLGRLAANFDGKDVSALADPKFQLSLKCVFKETSIRVAELRHHETKNLLACGDAFFELGVHMDSVRCYLWTAYLEWSLAYRRFETEAVQQSGCPSIRSATSGVFLTVLPRLIHSLCELGEHTHAIIVCQFLPTVDYALAFRLIRDFGPNLEIEYFAYLWEFPILECVVNRLSSLPDHPGARMAVDRIGCAVLNSSNHVSHRQHMISKLQEDYMKELCRCFLFRASADPIPARS